MRPITSKYCRTTHDQYWCKIGYKHCQHMLQSERNCLCDRDSAIELIDVVHRRRFAGFLLKILQNAYNAKRGVHLLHTPVRRTILYRAAVTFFKAIPHKDCAVLPQDSAESSMLSGSGSCSCKIRATALPFSFAETCSWLIAVFICRTSEATLRNWFRSFCMPVRDSASW